MENVMKKIILILLTLTFFFQNPEAAYAGDGATIILKSGTILRLSNGFNQISTGMRKLATQGSENFPVEVSIEGTNFFINLGDVAVLCRDTCGSMRIEIPKKER